MLSQQYHMDNTRISGKRFLFAFGITDGLMYVNPEQRISLIMDITEIKDNMLREENYTQEESI